MALRKGMHVRELTKKVGQVARTGVVVGIRDGIVEVRWDDGRVSTLSGAVLVPIQTSSTAAE
ncbi:hypothetical protein BMS3Abin02_00566 [bacterium BMS3Abin02]|nr:hypothetical protein BMS3Abin02_00566 [bacterium BMS3Abin02]GBE22989.1 hypothetical protein BMS3Bbin01_02367 [bacterium BMS3Bbin01]HDH26663.1 hypothetical protein [Actinomycetota bacterium]HDK45278.1 hypothetical protein [Actinomycetota bacterium]HDL49300.1 hypothetical protein [Actinomycetota bacterium]